MSKAEAEIKHMVLDVGRCARCGEDHKQLTFFKLARPTPRYKYWATCPTNGEPILMRVVLTKPKKKRARPHKLGNVFKDKDWAVGI